MPDNVNMTVPALDLRPYRPGDLLALYEVCLRTGNSGDDAQSLYRDPLLLGHIYAAPYATLCPDTTFVLQGGARVVGYVLGVSDSREYAARLEREWSPLLRTLYPLPDRSDATPDARLIRLIHQGYQVPASAWLSQYPAHLHIDLLPVAQGGGHGRRLMETLFIALRERGVSGVHLGVGLSNVRAQGFYERLGFGLLEQGERSLTYGLTL